MPTVSDAATLSAYISTEATDDSRRHACNTYTPAFLIGCFSLNLSLKGKVLPYLLTNVWPGAGPGVQAVSP